MPILISWNSISWSLPDILTLILKAWFLTVWSSVTFTRFIHFHHLTLFPNIGLTNARLHASTQYMLDQNPKQDRITLFLIWKLICFYICILYCSSLLILISLTCSKTSFMKHLVKLSVKYYIYAGFRIEQKFVFWSHFLKLLFYPQKCGF